MKKKKYISPRLRVVMLRAGQQLLAGRSNLLNPDKQGIFGITSE